ncbi:hypothetical protein Desaci_2332 [Desulfosporosinus acidiphilus SJ4]|uniref:Uncharacterized protein n=1 Tax=Desulfosporosinus acidiphilus (strain DSM 22704 / JCM 16185 / SJ4) TaxID=646529 RepID=I4D661_DESAJ|nr:hypothetical protein Desaci_2332 [Desulfosporosinus acidiphilus SJ4]
MLTGIMAIMVMAASFGIILADRLAQRNGGSEHV